MNLNPTKYLIICLFLALLANIGYTAFKKNQLERQIIALQNAAAEKDKTIEVQKGVFEKLTIQVKNAGDLLNGKDQQLTELAAELKKMKEQLLTVNTIAVTWKKAFETTVAGKETKVPGTKPGEKERTKVEFDKDFGYIGVNGWTLTDPPEAFVHIQNNRPLRLTLAVAQDKDKTWHTYATSSEDNVNVNIKLTGVNPYFLKPKWYEKIGIFTNLGISDSTLLTSVGASLPIFQFGKFDVGPIIWLSLIDTKISKFYGVSLFWHPFRQDD